MFMDNSGPEGPAPGTTGKYLVLMREDAVEEGIARAREPSPHPHRLSHRQARRSHRDAIQRPCAPSWRERPSR